jgi:DNA-binding GntR family transcriptional regulator
MIITTPDKARDWWASRSAFAAARRRLRRRRAPASELARSGAVSLSTDLAGHIGEHGDLLRAITDADADHAAELAAAHVAHFEQAIRAAL